VAIDANRDERGAGTLSRAFQVGPYRFLYRSPAVCPDWPSGGVIGYAFSMT